MAAARASPPDLVLCDLEMPRMGGVALCAALRADAATRRVPIVVVTGSGLWFPLLFVAAAWSFFGVAWALARRAAREGRDISPGR